MFKIHSIDGGRTPATEYLPAGDITPQVGTMLVLENGLLAPATGAKTPTYMCLQTSDAAVQSGKDIPVMRVSPDTIFETETKTDMSAVNLGQKIGLSADGTTVTTTEGAAETVWVDKTVVRVRFA